MLMYRIPRRSSTGLNVGYNISLCLHHSTNIIIGKTRCGLMSAICHNWFSFSNAARPMGNPWLDGHEILDHWDVNSAA